MSAAAAAREAASEAEEKRLRQRISSEDKRLNTLKAGRLQYAEQTRQFLVDGVQSQFELIKQDAEDEFAREKSALQDRLVQVKAVSREIREITSISHYLSSTHSLSLLGVGTPAKPTEKTSGVERERESPTLVLPGWITRASPCRPPALF